MNSNECNVARDLMPLVIDQVASEESRTLVEKHVAGCEPCAQVYADMQSKTPEQKDVADEVSFAAAMRQLRRTVGWRRMKVIVISVALTLCLTIAGSWGYEYFFRERSLALPLDRYSVNLSRTEDGTVLASVDYKGYDYGLRIGPARNSTGLDYRILYISADSPIIPIRSAEYLKNTRYDCYVKLRWRDGRCVTSDDVDAGVEHPIKEIRKGTESEYEVLYKEGDAIPLCPPALEEYLREEYNNELSEKVFVSFSASLVPEWR